MAATETASELDGAVAAAGVADGDVPSRLWAGVAANAREPLQRGLDDSRFVEDGDDDREPGHAATHRNSEAADAFRLLSSAKSAKSAPYSITRAVTASCLSKNHR